MIKMPMYPLRFPPIYQHRPWGGRRLGELLAGACSYRPRNAVSLLEVALPG
jgi:hypothetical protein